MPETDWLTEYERAAGVKRLSPVWAKIEIVLGLSAAVAGLRLERGDGATALAGAALIVLGLYLAMAGHRSHIYQAMNRQGATLMRLINSQPVDAVGTRRPPAG